MPKLHNRRSFVLIEVIVATSLFVMLLMVIFGIFWRTTKTNTALNKLRIANEQMLVTQSRLQQCFSSVEYTKGTRPYFFEEIDKKSNLPSLVFTMENMQTDADFSGNPIAKIYVDKEQLVLALFPHFVLEYGIPKVMSKEALLNNVTNFRAYFFYGPESQNEEKKPKKEDEEEDEKKEPPMGEWTDTWLPEYGRPPTLVKLEITRGKSEINTLYFFIPTMIKTILYDKD